MLPVDIRVQETASLYEAKRGINEPELGDREVETRADSVSRLHPAERIELKFLCLEDQAQIDEYRLQAVRNFTEGS